MAAQNDHERVEQLLNELAEIGAGFFIEGIKVSQWRIIISDFARILSENGAG